MWKTESTVSSVQSVSVVNIHSTISSVQSVSVVNIVKSQQCAASQCSGINSQADGGNLKGPDVSSLSDPGGGDLDGPGGSSADKAFIPDVHNSCSNHISTTRMIIPQG